ncbi:MAG: CapA family protein, partial [Clostridia bacterium]|nr:CapA family protein [Clostridia bacterium]
ASSSQASQSSSSAASSSSAGSSASSTTQTGAARISMIAVGDNLIHDSVMKIAQTSNSYNFAPFYTHMESYIANADISFINQESMMAGAQFGYSGWPRFNAPQQLGYTVRSLGFNIVNLANNHALDRGADGVVDNAKFWDGLGVAHIGTNENAQQQGTAAILNIKGIRVAFLGYTSSTNGIPLPSGKTWLVDMIDKTQMAADVKRAKQDADCVIVSLHWGNEFHHEYSTQQKQLAEYLASIGVDVIIGTHPHVIEPVEWITAANGHRMLVYYSLGNFISYQTKIDTMLGAMASFDIVKASDGSVTIQNAKAMPLVTHYEGLNTLEIYPLSQYTNALAARHSIKNYGKPASVSYFTGLAKSILGSFYSTGK